MILTKCQNNDFVCRYDHKVTVVQYDAFSLLVKLQKRYRNDVMVETEVISAIACLADVGKINQSIIQPASQSINQ